MRIVAGSAKGRVLAAPKSDDVIRPTADRVRETIFNVLGQRCDGLTVLDLFAELRDEETEHMRLVKDAMEALPPGLDKDLEDEDA